MVQKGNKKTSTELVNIIFYTYLALINFYAWLINRNIYCYLFKTILKNKNIIFLPNDIN